MCSHKLVNCTIDALLEGVESIMCFPPSLLSVQTDIEITREEDFARILQMEEEYIQQICEDIIRLKPDLVFTEKGISGKGSPFHQKWELSAQGTRLIFSTCVTGASSTHLVV